MKKTYFIFLIGFLLGLNHSFAQIEDRKGDIYLGLGFSTSNGFLSDVDGLLSGLGGITYQNTRSTGAFFLGYKTPIAGRLIAGATFAYEVRNQDVYENGNKIGDLSSRYTTFSFDLFYHYIDKEFFQMYSGIGLAYTTHYADYTTSSDEIEDSNDGYFNFQVTGVGFRVGKAFAFFTELGFGFKGLANLGLSYQF